MYWAIHIQMHSTVSLLVTNLYDIKGPVQKPTYQRFLLYIFVIINFNCVIITHIYDFYIYFPFNINCVPPSGYQVSFRSCSQNPAVRLPPPSVIFALYAKNRQATQIGKFFTFPNYLCCGNSYENIVLLPLTALLGHSIQKLFGYFCSNKKIFCQPLFEISFDH